MKPITDFHAKMSLLNKYTSLMYKLVYETDLERRQKLQNIVSTLHYWIVEKFK